MSSIKTVGIVGAGTMGNGIAQACAVSGIRAIMVDINEAAVAKGLATISGSLDRLLKKDKISVVDRDAALALLQGSTNYDDLKGADLVIEAATENLELKLRILRQLDGLLPAETLIASNTSAISITQLGAVTSRPDRFIGMHFFNPVPMMSLIEVVRGLQTSDDTHDAVRELALHLGKTPISVKNAPGFVVNRILMPMINEAVYTLYEGVGNVKSIDESLKLGANHPMGPLELADFIGLDTCLAIMNVLHDGLADTKYRPCPLLTKYVEAGWLGRKTQRGFYDYRGEVPVPTR